VHQRLTLQKNHAPPRVREYAKLLYSPAEGAREGEEEEGEEEASCCRFVALQVCI
jgi:hypothetical protein